MATFLFNTRLTMNRKGIIITIFVAVFTLSSFAQGRKDLRFNEVMTQNDSNLVDQYGQHQPWFEIFNPTYGTVGMEQMFIANRRIDLSNIGDQKPKDFLNDFAVKHPDVCYEIPRGDKDTKVAPRSHVVFFADGNTAAGSLHISFKLQAGREDSLFLYDVNGDLVDVLAVPANLPANCTYALIEDGISCLSNGNFAPKFWTVRNGANDDSAITPGKFNKRVVNENIEKFHKHDSTGGIITVTAMGIVFSALLLLFILFYLFGLANKATQKETNEMPAALADIPATDAKSAGDQPDEAIAAICLALYQHLNAHDSESGILTFNRDDQTAWSSKANLMRQLPIRK